MEVLFYNELEYGKVKKQFEKTVAYLKAGDFKSADAKKMHNTGYYRAKLDDTNRLLFKPIRSNGKYILLVLEVILNHAYEKSRFLNGAKIDDDKLGAIITETELTQSNVEEMTYVNPQKKEFHILDKVLSFDDIQSNIYELSAPIIIIGSAGSGKTALTLEKIKALSGEILYTTLSPYLVENSNQLYYSFEYENQKQEVEFLSFYELLSGIEVPQGKEINFRIFSGWIWKYKQAFKIRDPYKVFEEFKGIITGSVINKPYLSKSEYLNLGIKQSIFPETERPLIYDLFLKYLEFLKEGNYFDANMTTYQYLGKVEQKYDFVVIDEVQDITNVQLYFILKHLKNPVSFILCGDSNQIVHPNFFSWSNIKTMFYEQDFKGNISRVLATNYRNTPEVTKIANQLLLIKNARFGSIDKESTYLVKANSQQKGEVQYLENLPKIRQDLNQRTSRSAKFAVVVMREEDKIEARKYFNTPLLFSIHEVKGLEYENVILYNLISSYENEFRELTVGLNKSDLENEMVFNRAKDKSDKSLDEYKFYVNSLYVAITRAVKNLYLVETNKKHALLELLGLTNFNTSVGLKEQRSTDEEWQREAQKLEKQGKQEQADAIKEHVLKIQPVPWEVLTNEDLPELEKKALDPNYFNKKAKDQLYEYALFYNLEHYRERLLELKYRPADHWEKDKTAVFSRKFADYKQDNLKQIQPKVQKYGFDHCNEFNLTPYMTAVIYGATKTLEFLIQNGIKKNHSDNYGRNAFQLSILKCVTDSKYKATFNKIYHQISPNSLSVRIDNRLVKIDKHQGEYLILNYMIGVYMHKIDKYAGLDHFYFQEEEPYFSSIDFMNFYEGLSHQVIPDFRTQRTYISSLLAKNNYSKQDKYNKKIFTRIFRGKYIPNPKMEIEVNGKWIKIHELSKLDLYAKRSEFFLMNSIVTNFMNSSHIDEANDENGEDMD